MRLEFGPLDGGAQARGPPARPRSGLFCMTIAGPKRRTATSGAFVIAGSSHRRLLVKGIALTLATIWRLASPYFRSEDRLAGRVLLGALITIELSLVAINVMLNQWNNRFYN